MAFQFETGETVQQGARRLAAEELDRILRVLSVDVASLESRVRNTRKRCKRVRGLLRLIRPAMATASEESDALRDAARTLSDIRDVHSTLDALNMISSVEPPTPDTHRMNLVRAALVEQSLLPMNEERAKALLEDCRRRLAASRDRVDAWRVRGGRRSVVRGFRQSYARGRRAMGAALASRSTGDLHQSRKRVKDLWVHLTLLECVWLEVMRPLAGEAKALADLLGDDHDLAVLLDRLTALSIFDDGAAARAAITGAIVCERRRLQQRAAGLGARLYAAPPAAVARQLDACWRAWKHSP